MSFTYSRNMQTKDSNTCFFPTIEQPKILSHVLLLKPVHYTLIPPQTTSLDYPRSNTPTSAAHGRISLAIAYNRSIRSPYTQDFHTNKLTCQVTLVDPGKPESHVTTCLIRSCCKDFHRPSSCFGLVQPRDTTRSLHLFLPTNCFFRSQPQFLISRWSMSGDLGAGDRYLDQGGWMIKAVRRCVFEFCIEAFSFAS